MATIEGRETLFDGTLLRLERVMVSQDGGEAQPREVVHHGPGVAIVVIEEGNDVVPQGRHVVLTEQFRPPIERDIRELVAGLVDEGEDPLEAAKRELREEAGLEAGKWHKLGTIYSSPGFTDEKITLFLAQELTHVGTDRDKGEKLSIVTVPFTLALEEINEGKIQDGKTVAGLLLAAAYLSQEGE